MNHEQHNHIDPLGIVHAATFVSALVTAIQPIVSTIFMLVSIVSGCILIYKFFAEKFTKKKTKK